MKVCTILGTRPEIIRLSLIMKKLDEYCGPENHHVLYTGQNYDPRLSDIFWSELDLRGPDTTLECKNKTFGGQMGSIFERVEKLLTDLRPDKVLILGDTNSGLSAIVSARLGIPVYHMEAGNRCWDPRVPEELNRRIIDNSSTYNLPYTERSRDNLLREGFPLHRIMVSGNPIGEVLQEYEDRTTNISPWKTLLDGEDFALATFHRSENVDKEETLREIFMALHQTANVTNLPVIVSVHPRTRSKIESSELLTVPNSIILCEPFGFFDFIALEKKAKLVLTDSGTVQEECAILQTPCVVLRKSTERIECVEVGASIVAGTDPQTVSNAAKVATRKGRPTWDTPEGYAVSDVSERVVDFLQGTADATIGQR